MKYSVVFLLLLVSGTCLAQNCKNVALSGIATQSSVNTGLHGDASHGNDGNKNSILDGKSCTHTTSDGETNPWWTLDLHESYRISYIIITNRGDCCAERINGAKVYVGNSLKNNGVENKEVGVINAIPAGSSFTLTFTDRVEGRYVTVSLPGQGKILTLCEVEVYGEQTLCENVALSGTATQSSVNAGLHGDASHGNDGNKNSVLDGKSCTHTTGNGETNPWWTLDLHESYRISSIIITNRGDCCAERINGAKVYVGNSLKDNGVTNPEVGVINAIPAGSSFTLTFTDRVEGRYVTVSLPGQQKILTLCEVEVYGERSIVYVNDISWQKVNMDPTLAKHHRFPVIRSLSAGATVEFHSSNMMDGRYVNIAISGRQECLTQ